MGLKATLGLTLFAAVLAGATPPILASSWSEAVNPTAGPAQPIGGPANGCIAGAKALPLDGPGYEAIRVSRRRYFGHPGTVAFVERLGRQAKAEGLQTFYVGDMSQPRGGPMSNGHGSHQTGLDVDIWFNLDPKPQLKPVAREDVPLPSMLRLDKQEPDPTRFGAAQIRLLKLAAADPAVDRIFINPALKRALCVSEPNRAWLHRLRPWWGHDEHFHVRLACPPGAASCVSQAPVPPGDGCDASLAWWFEPKPAAPVPAPSTPAKPKARPPLPQACKALEAERS